MILCDKFEPFFELLDDELANTIHKNIRYVVLIGGRGGAKSHALGTWINAATYKEGWGIYFTRWTMKSAERSIIPLFIDLCDRIGNTGDFRTTRTQAINTTTDVTIDYSGLKPQSNQSSGDSKSLAKKNIFVVEEAEDVQNFELFDKADNSIRTIEYKNIVILCLNQGHVGHWIYKDLIADKTRDDVMVIETTYLDNLEYLDESFIRKAERVKARDLKRYNHIYLNEWKSDVDGALWMDRDISPFRISSDEFADKEIRKVVVAYDPAVTDSDKTQAERTANTGNEPDEDGIVIAAKCKDGQYYVLKDKTCRGRRSDIAKLLCKLYHDHDANFIVIEKNNGGDFIPALIKTVDKYVRCQTVTATKGKARRAQPVQALYENGEVHHVGYFSELEHEMTTWVPDIGLPSPNRMDALVWALSYLAGIVQSKVQVRQL